MKIFRTLMSLALSAAVLGANVSAATIKYAGMAQDTKTASEASHWRSPSVKKTMAIGGSNVYGNLAAVIWTRGSLGEQHDLAGPLGWAYAGAGDQLPNASGVQIDDVQDASAATAAGYCIDHVDFILTGNASDFQGKTVRIGVMEDILDEAGSKIDAGKALQLVQTAGSGSGGSGIVTLRKGAAGTRTAAIYFFDVTNVSPGDAFKIKALTDQDGRSGAPGYVGPVFWDISVK